MFNPKIKLNRWNTLGSRLTTFAMQTTNTFMFLPFY